MANRLVAALRLALASFGLALALVRLDRPAASLGTPLACERAQLIDGELRCDGELEQASRDGRAIGPGDAVVHAGGRTRVTRMPPEQLAALEQAVDINRASPEEIASLPGIGPTIAARIVAGRPYASVEALLEVEGIGPKRLEAMRSRVRLGP